MVETAADGYVATCRSGLRADARAAQAASAKNVDRRPTRPRWCRTGPPPEPSRAGEAARSSALVRPSGPDPSTSCSVSQAHAVLDEPPTAAGDF
jgi:hypothetical protein